MSLGRFLAAGKSFIGMKDENSPYRMRRENLLPKFNLEKSQSANPFAAPAPATAPASVEAPKPEPEPVKPAIEKNECAKSETPSLFDPPSQAPVAVPAPVVAATEPALPVPAAIPTPADVQVTAEPKKPARVETPSTQPASPGSAKPKAKVKMKAPSQPRVPLGERLKKLNPLKWLPARAGSSKAARSRGVRAAVQAELSLEKVRVVRNDLSDADLEVIPARAPQAAMPSADTASVTRRVEPVMTPARTEEPTAWGRLTSRFFNAGQQTQVR